MDPEEEARLAEEQLAAAAADPPPAGDPPAPAGDPPPETPPAPAGETDPPPAEPPPAPAEEPPPSSRGSRTFEARIGELSADKRRLREENARLQAELARVRGSDEPPAPAEGDPPPEPQRTSFATQEEFNRAVTEEAERRATVHAFNERCNAVDDAGTALGADRWRAAKRNLGLLDDDGRIPYELLSVALETEKPEQVLLQLGEDPDRAAALLRMTPTKRALEIAKMTTTPPKPAAGGDPPAPVRSKAPDPIEPIQGRSAPPERDVPTDTDSDAEWLRKRNAQLERQAIQRSELARKLA